jgi:hypothetical protein
MPELDVIYIQVCSQTSVSEKMPSSRGGHEYNVSVGYDESLDYCECDGFRFRRKCRHVDALRQKLCCWNEQISDEKQTPQQEMEGKCPKCGAETCVIRWGV